MNLSWYYSFGTVEYMLIGVFLLAALLYIGRFIHLVKAIHKRKRLIFVKLPLRLAYFLILLVALLGPSFGLQRKYMEAVGKDIYLAIDLSNSMDAQDVAPSRLEKLKYEIKNIYTNLSSDRVGIIIFSSEAFLQCPLTYDRSALDLFTQTLHTDLTPGGGTDFYPPLALALDRMLNKERTKRYTSKIVILASDGEDHGEDTEEILEEYRERGVRIFCLGVGTGQGSTIPNGRGYPLHRNGKIVQTSLNFRNLTDLSQQTNGAYYEISRDKNEVASLIQHLREIKGEKLDLKTLDVSYNKYEYFLLVALALICLDFLLIIKVLRI